MLRRRPTIAGALGPSRAVARRPWPCSLGRRARRPCQHRQVPTQPKPELPILEFPADRDWEAWLAVNHATSPGAWLKIAKRGAAATTVTHPDALDTAICFGWIDGQRRPLDETFFLQRFTPRGPRSKWSQINCGKAEQLISNGRMRKAGLAQVQAARADGRWEAAYEPQSRATVPADLQRALDADPRARQFFDTLTGVAAVRLPLPPASRQDARGPGAPDRLVHRSPTSGQDTGLSHHEPGHLEPKPPAAWSSSDCSLARISASCSSIQSPGVASGDDRASGPRGGACAR